MLLNCIGEEALDIYNLHVIEYEDPQHKKISEVLAAFQKCCPRRKNTVFERHKFCEHTFSEQAGIDKFVTELRNKARTCEFGETEDPMIRDKTVFSTTDSGLRERLLSIPDLTLSKAIDICRAKEVTKATSHSNGSIIRSTICARHYKKGVTAYMQIKQTCSIQKNSRVTRSARKKLWQMRMHSLSQDSALPLMKYGKNVAKKHFAVVCKSKAKMNMLETVYTLNCQKQTHCLLVQ